MQCKKICGSSYHNILTIYQKAINTEDIDPKIKIF